MLLDDRTIKLLELERVLAELHPITPFGQKAKCEMKPYLTCDQMLLVEELDRVEKLKELVNTQRAVFVEIRTAMRQIKDIRKSVERCMAGGVLNAVEFFELKNLVYLVKAMSESQKTLHWEIPEKYTIEELQWVEDILDPEKTGLKTFYLYDSYSPELYRIRQLKAGAEQKMDLLRKEVIKKVEADLGMAIRPNGEVTVSKGQAELIKKLQSYRLLLVINETYINMTFRVKPTDEMYKLINAIEELKGEEALEEARILEVLSSKVAVRGEEILRVMDSIGEFDLLTAKAYQANTYNAVKPVIRDEAVLKLKNGRHPIVEAGLRKKGREYTPISVCLTEGVTLITGANMGGKTVSLKLLGLMAAMAQYGLLVPAESLEMSMNEFIFLSAGDEQSIDLGLSTFGAEIQSIKEALEKSSKRGLILIDELARGTNPQEGFAISAAIIRYLMQKPGITVITTHFDGLVKPHVKHLQVNGLRNIDCSKIKNPEHISEYMDYTLIEIEGDGAVPRDALNISRLMGVPEEIITIAEELLGGRQ